MNIRLADLPAFSCRGNGHEDHEEVIAFEIAILKELQKGDWSALCLSDALHSGYKSTLYHLKTLADVGLVVHNGKVKGRVWRLA
jgi:hypothetical protein